MKITKSLINIIHFVFFSLQINAQQFTETVIHQNGGTSVTYQLSGIDSITYNQQNTNMIIHEIGGTSIVYPIISIDSVTFISQILITCPTSILDSRDGEAYSVIKIGSQCWMSENLRYISPGSVFNSTNPSNWGRLYDWFSVMNGSLSSSANPSGVQGLCPNGWHLPSDSEWNQMEIALGMSVQDSIISGYRGSHGSEMKASVGWNGTNSSGFNAFPTGSYSLGNFHNWGSYTYFWSSSESSSSGAWLRNLGSGEVGVYRNDSSFKNNKLSCRCIKD